MSADPFANVQGCESLRRAAVVSIAGAGGGVIVTTKAEKPEVLPVIFRMWRGEVIALFPTMHESLYGRMIQSYMHVGQHSPASYQLTQAGRPATPEEREDLLTELRGIYEFPLAEGDTIYKLKVIRRRPRGAYS